jgi:ADP-ribose pyrophosphatase YjhB (NUDIX family)
MAQQLRICNVVIEKDGKYLLVQEGQPKAYKLWNLPGGHVDSGETLEQTAAREALEETGYTVTILKQLLVFDKPQTNVLLHAYLAEITGGELHIPSEEILDAKWFSYNEIMTMEGLRDPEYITRAVKAAQTANQ